MPFGHTWTLWQRLPPRYQLTSRYVEEYVDLAGKSLDNSWAPRLYPTPRPDSASMKESIDSQDLTNDTHLKENKIDRNDKFRQRTCQTASFPRRKSDYVTNFQTQRKVSSARRRLAEAPPSPAVNGPGVNSFLLTSNRRAQTAPAFPVTSPEFHEEQNRKRVIEKYIRNNNQRLSSSKNRTKHAKGSSNIDVFHFDDSKSAKRGELDACDSNATKKYIVQETNDAVMYVDNGKVNYFKKSRHDLTNLLKTQTLRGDRSTCFLAELRRDYLKHPKYGQKRPSDKIYKQSLTDPRVIASERVNYNNRLERILKYYADNERDPNQESSRSRPTSGLGSPIKGLSLTGTTSRPPSRESSSPDRPDSPNNYITLHKRSKLHDKQFYLRTPSQKHAYSTKELESCRCCMCRVELQLALVTGAPSDIALAATKPKPLSNPASCNESIVLTRSKTEGYDQLTQSTSQDKTVQAAENKQTTNRVTFKQPEVTKTKKAKPKEHTLTISCTLPDMTDIALSESGIDTSRTEDIVTPNS